MIIAAPVHAVSCPDPLARAPRHPGTTARLHLPGPVLRAPVLCVLCRDLRGASLHAAQRLTHLPATPFICLTVAQGSPVGIVSERDDGTDWQPFGASIVLSGSQSTPMVTWSPGEGRVVLVLFTPEGAQSLFGLHPQDVHDRFMDAHEELGEEWWAFLDALTIADTDRAVLDVLKRHVMPRWKALCGEHGAGLPSLRQVGRHWLDSIAARVLQTGGTLSARQVERRIKTLSGRSMRQWGTLLKAESVFFAARDRHESGLPLDWADLAAQEGFADQSHLVRAAKRVTGFTPTDFVQRYLEDESFWLYRLWV